MTVIYDKWVECESFDTLKTDIADIYSSIDDVTVSTETNLEIAFTGEGNKIVSDGTSTLNTISVAGTENKMTITSGAINYRYYAKNNGEMCIVFEGGSVASPSTIQICIGKCTDGKWRAVALWSPSTSIVSMLSTGEGCTAKTFRSITNLGTQNIFYVSLMQIPAYSDVLFENVYVNTEGQGLVGYSIAEIGKDRYAVGKTCNNLFVFAFVRL